MMPPTQPRGLLGRARHALAACVAYTMLAAGMTKLISGHSPDYSMPPSLYFSSAAAECLAPLLIHMQQTRVLALAAVLLSAVGIGHDLLLPGRSCGCFGSVLTDPRMIWMLRGILGAAAMVLLWMHAPSSQRPVGQRA